MTLQPTLIAGQWQRESKNTFYAVNPTTTEPLPDSYPISGEAALNSAVEAGYEAAQVLKARRADARADFLERYAELIEENREVLSDMAHQETGLAKEPRLNTVEIDRTSDQLRQAAKAVRERSWVEPIIDTVNNIRSMYGSLNGPVVVFGPNNFPFAFNGVSGGDFAAAIAAGNPVIAKANPGHPGTSYLLCKLAFKAVQESGLPNATVQMFYHCTNQAGLSLVSHPKVAATGFTGSKRAGLALKAAADKAGKPIYLEMSSVNPVFILTGALEERLEQIVDEFCTSCLLGAGQFCTNPGLVVLPGGNQSKRFINKVLTRFDADPSGVLLSKKGLEHASEGVNFLCQNGARLLTGGKAEPEAGFSIKNTLLSISAETFLEHPDVFQTEVFGPVALLVNCNDGVQTTAVAQELEGNLTGTIYSHSGYEDDEAYEALAPVLRERVGRLIENKMPTGVTVSPAMNHGGPYPATGHPGFSAVGIPGSMRRFAALYSYENVRNERLPPELQDENPLDLVRRIDEEWGRAYASNDLI